ncbi:GNAT family N-acetyltransferase [Streptococcus cuniculi]|uniref:GNAT family N-acetyltransferase n=1 Tax=Streptococcus cuniculi TaxID=1432788 RepID=A0A4Y9JEC8_9STRE|nr:GNAT family N-acetyltransferase [Streptococcus cuniculi]MBF0777309.1 GNAT family N-acetyltransferase [Streptococcus cuniculi]TFU98911.1 GNAT family N-acetyltransferase [Streptococcus cuniculi]
MQVEIKSVQPDEVDVWLSFASKVWTSNLEQLRVRFLKEDFPYEFLYWKSGKALAWLSLSIRREYVEGCSSLPIAYLEGIAVLPQARKQGIARELLTFAKQWAKEQGCSQLASDCALNNTTSQEFHHKIGFREVGRSIHYIVEI